MAGPRLGEGRETAEALDRAVAALPGDQRAVIVLRDIEGLSPGEACFVLGIGEPEQRGLLHEARRHVHADIGARLPNGGDEPDESKAEPGRVAWIDTIAPERARGDLADLYRAVSTSRGAVANVLVAQSLNVQALRAHLDLYRAVIFQGSSLSREARERIGVAVSTANRSLYCVTHHAEALSELGTSTDEVEALTAGETPATVGPADRALLRWAKRAAVDPAACTEEDVAQMRVLGLDDRAILDAALTVAYFSFVNRLVLMLGVEVEIDPAASCRNVHEDSW